METGQDRCDSKRNYQYLNNFTSCGIVVLLFTEIRYIKRLPLLHFAEILVLPLISRVLFCGSMSLLRLHTATFCMQNRKHLKF